MDCLVLLEKDGKERYKLAFSKVLKKKSFNRFVFRGLEKG